MIKTVIFDIGNVLADFAWEPFFRKFGFKEAIFEKLANATVRSPQWHEFDRGALSHEEIIEAFISNDPDVDAVGSCVGKNGERVNSIVEELRGEKIDIVNWDDNPGNLIQNALSPAKIVAVFADPDEKTAKVVVPDYQLSLAIGKEGQNARLAARLTGYKIDIKSETQAKDTPGFRYEDYMDDEESDEDYEGYEEE